MNAKQFKFEIESVLSEVRKGFDASFFTSDEQLNEAIFITAAEKLGFICKFFAGAFYCFTNANWEKFMELREEGEAPNRADYCILLSDIINA